MKTLRAAILGWYKGEVRRYQAHEAMFAEDAARLAFTRKCLRDAYRARHYYRKRKRCIDNFWKRS